MQTLNITLPDTLVNALNNYINDQENLLPDDIVENAIIEFLSQRGYLPPKKPLNFTPSTKGSGFLDTSVNHDHTLSLMDELARNSISVKGLSKLTRDEINARK